MNKRLAAFAGTVRRIVGWLRRRRGYVCGVDVALDGAETTVLAKIRGNGTIEVIDIIETKPANTSAHGLRASSNTVRREVGGKVDA